ncbi:MAG: polysaccharide deacetylase family protein [Egibacteraceae bacterium]
MRLRRAASGESRLLVFCWHNIEGTWRFPFRSGLRSGLCQFERQLRALRQAATVVPLGRALRALGEGHRLPGRAVALTFDDGYRDHLTSAIPLLSRLGLPATMFLVPGILAGDVDPWSERLGWAVSRARSRRVRFEGRQLDLPDGPARLRAMRALAQQLAPRDRHQRSAAITQLEELLAPEGSFHAHELYLDWDGARQLAAAGVDIGSHSMHHEPMSTKSVQEQRSDLSESRRVLQERLDVPVDLFAYPYGQRSDFNASTVAAAGAAGYRHAATTLSMWNRPTTPPYEIRRLVISPAYGVPGLLTVLARGLASATRNAILR